VERSALPLVRCTEFRRDAPRDTEMR